MAPLHYFYALNISTRLVAGFIKALAEGGTVP
jgi:hypothetical protein